MPRAFGLTSSDWHATCDQATELLRDLLRVDTTNPPGNEIAAATLLRDALAEDGLTCEIIESAPTRANLICRLRSGNDAPPLLLAGHTDVVPAEDADRWTRPPFSGDLFDGYVWGRGAVDMKNMVAMSATVMRLLARHQAPLRRDVIFAAVADEETGCTHGSRYLVENHPEKVRAGFALGEVGGFPLAVKGARICPVQTAEKGVAWLRATVDGPAGHGSMPMPQNATLRLSRAVARLRPDALPHRVTPVAEAFVRALADALPIPDRWVLPGLLHPRVGPIISRRLIKDPSQARNFNALLHDTVAPTVLRAGSATNVIPDNASVELDGRTLPGHTADDLIRQLRQVIDDDGLRFEVLNEAPATLNHPPDSELWDCIRRVIGRHDPQLTVVPTMIPGFTDGKWFSQLGTRWYGFSPLRLDPTRDPGFAELFHGRDERIPHQGFCWGLGVLAEVVEAFCCVGTSCP